MKALLLLLLAFPAFGGGNWTYEFSDDAKAIKIDASELRRMVTHLASDELEGRGTPSTGLDKAADFIAEEFKKAGLTPGVGESYFQKCELAGRDGTKFFASNVIGMLKGSDPSLSSTYVLVTAHYDHLGKNERLTGDQIFNGATDNASGTAGIIAAANALAKLKQRPKRSILFIAWCGEERGLLGARYYATHPAVPLAKTVAMLNLEQIGRTDDSEGPRLAELSMTGFDMSDMSEAMSTGATAAETKITMHARNSDSFFFRSDNAALAERGIIAHSVCTAFMFPDYHRVSDHADKLDYENMAKVTRAIALGVLVLADSSREATWSESEKAKRYRDAWTALRSGG
jgi:hypothetical protein